jgi:hypothetical protein
MERLPDYVRTIDLGYDQLLTFEAHPGARVRVLYGSLWLTEEGDSTDYFPRNGDEVALHSRGQALIGALGPTRVQILDEPQPSAVVGWLRQGAYALRRFVRRARERLQLGAKPQPQLGI